MKKALELSNGLFCSKSLFCSLAIALLYLTGGCAVFQSGSEASQAEASDPSHVISPSTRTIAVQSAQPQSFAQWCQRKSTVPAATKQTINVLLKIAKPNNCELADARLRSGTLLDLRDSRVSDLRPLASFEKLEYLWLSNNQISDLTPFANLSNLRTINLDHNLVRTLRPLAGLTKVDAVYLDNNQISDLRPLVSLKNVYYIRLNNNQISDLQPLASMSRLSTINLEKNRISNVKPLAALSGSLRELILNDNQITDLRPLAALHRLEQLHVRKNPLSDKTCPIQRINIFDAIPNMPHFSVCRFDEA
jgi:internalin A